MALVVLATKGFHLFFISFWSCGRSCCCCCPFLFWWHWYWFMSRLQLLLLLLLLLLLMWTKPKISLFNVAVAAFGIVVVFFLLLQLVVVCCCQNWTIQFMFCFLYDCIRHSTFNFDSVRFHCIQFEFELMPFSCSCSVPERTWVSCCFRGFAILF